MRYNKKPFSVDAIQLKGPIALLDEVDGEEVKKGGTGDWLITFDNGHQAILPDARFHEEYELATPEAPKRTRTPKTETPAPEGEASAQPAKAKTPRRTTPAAGRPDNE